MLQGHSRACTVLVAQSDLSVPRTMKSVKLCALRPPALPARYIFRLTLHLDIFLFTLSLSSTNNRHLVS